MDDLITTSVSCEMNETDRPILRELARRHDISVGRLVRQAIDTCYGAEMEEIRPFFVAKKRSQKSEHANDKPQATAR